MRDDSDVRRFAGHPKEAGIDEQEAHGRSHGGQEHTRCDDHSSCSGDVNVCLTPSELEHDEPDPRRAVQINDGNASNSERADLFIQRGGTSASNEENVKPPGTTGGKRDDELPRSNVVNDRNEVEDRRSEKDGECKGLGRRSIFSCLRRR
jgi:hypothetical protein